MNQSPWNADKLLESMIRFPSVSDTDNREITTWVGERLTELDFTTEWMTYRDPNGVDKHSIVGRRGPAAAGGLIYFAHSDVVPAAAWSGPATADGRLDPFSPVQSNNRMYGRGSCDMKGSFACMLSAASRVTGRQQAAPLTIVCTADEEIGFWRARHVAAHSKLFRNAVQEQPVGIIGEPTCMRVVHAHKGVAVYKITSQGRAAHSSTREGLNANLAMVPMLAELVRLNQRCETDPTLQNKAFNPPTLSWNFGVSDQAVAYNITPAMSRAWVCFRPMPNVDGQVLVDAIQAKADELGLDLAKSAKEGPPLWVDPAAPELLRMCEWVGQDRPETVCYGTDGGCFTELQRLLVCGPGNIDQAHTADEWISMDELVRGVEIYHLAIQRWCQQAA